MRHEVEKGRTAVLALGLGLALLGAPRATLAAKPVTLDACVVERKPTSALMTPGDHVLFELDLRAVPNTPFALKPGDCVTLQGLDRDNEPGLRREFPQGSWLVEALSIQAATDHTPPVKRSNGDDD